MYDLERINERIGFIVRAFNASHEDAKELIEYVGASIINADKVIDYLLYGLSFDEIKVMFNDGLFKHESYFIINCLNTFKYNSDIPSILI